MTPGEVAEKCRVPRRWYSRLLANGLARIDKRTRPGPERLAHHYGLGRVEELWDPKLDRLRRRAGVDREILSWCEKAQWPHAKKLLELLETGEHDFLKGLIDSLHASELLREGTKHVTAGREGKAEPALKRRLGPKKPSHG